MAKILVLYYSKTGNTKAMAEYVQEGAESESVDVRLSDVEQSKPADMLEYDAIIIGSPTYYGTMAAEIKAYIDKSVRYHGNLSGKVGAAFSSSAHIGGGNETTILDILNAMLIHGMIVQGSSDGDHYGPVSVDAPDDRVRRECKALGARTARLIKQLSK